MAELTLNDRLQPALLDRLTDDDPAMSSEPRETRIVSRQCLRQAVLRDLAWLLNATRMVEIDDWSAVPAAQHSVINFGMPAFAGETASTLDPIELERSMRQTIIDFEPRIDPATLEVKVETALSALDHHNQIQLHIRGKLWAQPVPIELLLRTEVDLESGQVDIEDLGH